MARAFIRVGGVLQRTGTSRTAWLLAAVVAGTLSAAPPAASHDLRAPPVEPAPLAPAPTNASSPCATCHAEIAREWDASQHHRAASDPSYVASLTREPKALPFCRKCHAPSADPAFATPAPAREHGIGCVDCHAGMDRAHATPSAAPAPASARACACCHEFGFPAGTSMMQKTETEHQASAYADVSCASCHMPSIAGGRSHHDHTFRVTGAMLSQALVADVARAKGTRIAFRLRPGEIGHAFPTGDLFRRLVVRVEAVRDGRVEASAERYLYRHFRSVALPSGESSKVETSDDRVGASLEPCFELDVGPRGRDLPLRIEIALERVEQPRGSRERDAEVSAHVPVWTKMLDGAGEGKDRPCR